MSGGHDRFSVTAVVLAYGTEPLLEDCVQALLGSDGIRVDVVVVDNGCTSDAVARVDGVPGVRVLRPGRNTGFAGGCNLGARQARGEVLVLVNSDAVVRSGAAAALADVLAEPGVGIASGGLRLIDHPDTMNSAGNPVHYLGLSWAGGLGESATLHAVRRPVASATGAVMALRREAWEELGGFFEPMFAYGEDMELSLRCWQRGWTVEFVPDAVALHAYEFHRNPLKMYLLERNRLLVVLTLYERRTLALLALPLLALELAVLVVAVRQGWWRQKVRGWWWLARHAGLVRRRRAEVQAARRLPDAQVATVLTGSFNPGEQTGFSAPRPLALASTWCWSVVRRGILQVTDTS
ncbi:MAG: glycosyltransferase family 2 protein [Nocardioidaceae bacterium]